MEEDLSILAKCMSDSFVHYCLFFTPEKLINQNYKDENKKDPSCAKIMFNLACILGLS